ncbi:hypothetical protein TrVE_jg13384 [Triparma verrucosa]|nr:hypothetical protein TrVE_jg13384 [Triparma verrucosa]
MNANVDYFIRSLSVTVRSHLEDDTQGKTGTKEERRDKREQMVKQLPLGFRSWVVCALRKKAGELKYAFNTWKRKCGMEYMVNVTLVESILSKASQYSAINSSPFSHTEEDLETLHQYVLQNGHSGNLFSKILNLTSRNDLINSLNSLRLVIYKPNTIILMQNRPNPSQNLEASYTVVRGSVNLISLPEVMRDAESVKSVYRMFDEEGVRNPQVSVGVLSEWRMGGDEEVVGGGGSFGEVPQDWVGEYENSFMGVSVGETSCITMDFKCFCHVNKNHGRAEELRQRITFLKNSKLFPNFSHAEVTDLAGKLKKESYSKNEIICQNGTKAQCFYFILTGEVLCQYFPPGFEAQGEEVIHPSHDWNIILKHNSVLGEDVLLGSPIFDVTAVANSETVTVYKVPKVAWEPFKPLMVQERLIGLLYKDKLKTEKPLVTLSKIMTLHKKFTSVRSIISQTRPHRGVVGLHEYNNAESSKKALLSLLEEEETTATGFMSPLNARSRASPTSTPAFNRSPSRSLSSPTNKRKRLRSQNSQVSIFSSAFDDDSVASDSKMTRNPPGEPEHAKLDQHTVVHLGEAQRKALLLADEQRRAMRKEEAVTKNRGFRDRLVSSFRKANEVNNKLQLQFLEKERREERQRLEETVVEVHAALLLAKEGAAAHNQEKIDPGAELKKVVGSILFGEESEDVAMTPAQKKKLNGRMAQLKAMSTFGAGTFKRRVTEAKAKQKPKKKSWNKEQNRLQEIKDKREARIGQIRSLLDLCDDAASNKDLSSTAAGDGDGKLSFAEEEQLMEKAQRLLSKIESVGGRVSPKLTPPDKIVTAGDDDDNDNDEANEDTAPASTPAPAAPPPATPATPTPAPADNEADEVKMVKMGAKNGWGTIKKVTTTHLDKQKEGSSAGVKKMLMSTVRAVGTEDVAKKESEADMLSKLNSGEIADDDKPSIDIKKVVKLHQSIPNTRYFKAAAKLEKRKNPFLDFDAVLSLSALTLQNESLDPSMRLASGLKEFTHATSTLSPREATNKQSLRDVTSILASASDPLCGRTLDPVQEWQVYHVQKVLQYKESMKSLPNLNGVKGKCKTRSREVPKLITM